MPDALTVIRHAERPSMTLPGGAAYQPIVGDDTGAGMPIRTGIHAFGKRIVNYVSPASAG